MHQQKENFFLIFFIFFFLSAVLWVSSYFGVLNGTRFVLERIFSPLQSARSGLFQAIPSFFADPRIKILTKENISLRNQISGEKRLEIENAALLAQYQTIIPRSYGLMPAKIIGMPGFLPGISAPTTFTLDKGERDGIKVGLSVVFENNLVGKITKVTPTLSRVDLITNTSSSFVAKTESNILGVAKGDGEKIILDHVILSQNLKVSDTVLTYGDLNVGGSGYPADLIVGKIISVEKNPSDLFQEAELKSNLDFSTLTTVFVIIQP